MNLHLIVFLNYETFQKTTFILPDQDVFKIDCKRTSKKNKKIPQSQSGVINFNLKMN